MGKFSFIIRLAKESDFYSYSILSVMTLLAFIKYLECSVSAVSVNLSAVTMICRVTSTSDAVTLKPVESGNEKNEEETI